MSTITHDYLRDHAGLRHNARRTWFVIILTFLTMIAEIIAGQLTGSMALTADGWHMGSHVAALAITLIAYHLAAHPNWIRNFNFGGGKVIPLGGYTSALTLLLISVLVGWESVERLLDPTPIHFVEALWVACIGLVVNILSVFLLRGSTDHHHHHHDADSGIDHYHVHVDHNIRGAYFHVLADAITSLAAIAALVIGRMFQIVWLDAVVGLLGSLMILHWAITLIRDTGWELMDGHAKGVPFDKIKAKVESDSVQVLDLHVWKIAPSTLACELIVKSKAPLGVDHYKNRLAPFAFKHLIIEEQT